jgi:hypothetical protein
MAEATGGRRYYSCQWTQEVVETLYNLLNNNNNNNNNNNLIKLSLSCGIVPVVSLGVFVLPHVFLFCFLRVVASVSWTLSMSVRVLMSADRQFY